MNADSPKDVTIKAQPDVDENKSLTLSCAAKSFPQADTFILTKDGKEEIKGSDSSFSIKSVSPSHSGLYRCTAKNEIGTGQSREVKVKVNCE